MMTLDSHHHFWRYTPAEYGWIDDAKKLIRRDFLPADLQAVLSAAKIDGAISVHARQSLAETDWLLSLADQHDFLRGVVGWVPLASAGVEAVLQEYASNQKLRGVRHVVHDEPDDQFILGDAFNRGVSLLKKFDLRYDILIFEKHLPATIEFVDRHPQQVFIVDHIAKPRIKTGEIDAWKRNLIELAKRPNVYCKLSGMVTEADYNTWTPAALKPYFDVVLNAFTPSRVMYGSDWPVCLVAAGYQTWVDTVRDWTKPLSATEQARIFGQTASEAYGL